MSKDNYKLEWTACTLQDDETYSVECEDTSIECEECPIYIKYWADFEIVKRKNEEAWKIIQASITSDSKWTCEDYPDNCDGQDPECKRKDCPWFQYSEAYP